MVHIRKLVVLLPMLLAGCATYETQPVHTTVTGYSYGAAPYYSYSPPVYYVEPAPVYVVPPAYARPTPSFSARIQSAPRYEQHDRPPRHRHGRGPRDDDEHTGNARDSRIGGPGWSGSVWSR